MSLNAATPPSDDAGHVSPSSVAVIALLQQQLEEAQRLAGIGSWSWDLDSGSVTWSRETYRILGIDPATPPSFEAVLALAVDATRQEQFLAMVHAALRGEREYDFEVPAKLGSGRVITIHTRGSVERASDGTPLRMVGTMQDVTAMRAAEATLREREAQFRTLAESSPTGVFQTNTAGHTVYANQRLLHWFDLSLEQFAAGEWFSRVHPEDLPTVTELSMRTRDRFEPFDAEYRIVVHGHIRWLRVRSEPFVDGDGVSRLGHIGSVLDTSAERFAAEERTRLQSQLQQARRLESLGLLAGGIAHDFNNLLVGILANASLARDDLPLEHSGREALDDIAHAAQRAADLTRQLLAYAGRARVERRQVALPALVAELPKVLGARVPSQIAFTVAATEPLLVDGDETQLRQIILNLVTNAVDALGSSEGRIELRVASRECTAADLQRCLLGRDRTPGRYAVVTVQDTGAGMSAEVQERMFDPFYTTKRSGRGLGLAATLGALNSHLGAILVESTVGIGTTIHVLLPVSVRQGTPESVPAIPDTNYVGSGTVLLVDDDASARSAALRILSRAGYDVREAENGADAIVQYETLAPPPRCIVLDLSMPIMSGDECLHVLRARGSTVPVLMSSGYDADDVAGHLVEPGSVHFLQKPYTAGALLKAVGELIGPS
ncbi:hybrid sensor histidine kinase/response regulator [Gemmatimonas phototrophica]|uniref:hybrid sensor histidine kinase/response regulator n=1 Tax=Gemmatimonas phototrophica TaxID=1379270 RepID=UPI001313F905|nr:hybrid sensor histidine kinase/response regulator [Gemmatimonas phototrophica]